MSRDDLKSPEGDDRPNTVIRPPRLYLAALLAGLGLDYLWPAPMFAAPGRYIAGGLLASGGLWLGVTAIRQFGRAGTNVPTVLPATALVTDGLYRFSRNPIYIGLTSLYLGLALLADSVWTLGLVVPVLVVMQYGVIRREERYLEDKFGDAYRDFLASTRRWL